MILRRLAFVLLLPFASPAFAEQAGGYLDPAQIELARSALREHPEVSAEEQRQAEVIADPYALNPGVLTASEAAALAECLASVEPAAESRVA